MKRKCQCPEKGILSPTMEGWYDQELELPFVNHEENKCECKNELKQFVREGKKLWPCSNCRLPGDKKVNK